MEGPKGNGDWATYARYVLAELERLDKWCHNLQKKQTDLEIKIAQLQIKSGAWGAAASLISLGIMMLLKLFFESVNK